MHNKGKDFVAKTTLPHLKRVSFYTPRTDIKGGWYNIELLGKAWLATLFSLYIQ